MNTAMATQPQEHDRASAQPVCATPTLGVGHWLVQDDQRALSADAALTVITFLRRTHGRVVCDGATLHDGAIPPGTSFVGTAGPLPAFILDGGCDALSISAGAAFVAGCACPDDTGQRTAPSGWRVLRDEAIELLARSLLLSREADCTPGCAERMAMPIVARALHLIAGESTAATGRIRLPQWRMRRVDNYIRDHIGGRISSSDLASAAHLSVSHFASVFRDATGETPCDYVMARRIEVAKGLLQNPACRIAEVARRTGFRTPSHFATAFKARTGHTPREWRSRSA